MALPVIVLSLCDIQKVVPNFEIEWLEKYKSDSAAFLRNMGFNTDYGIEVQEGLQHRSKFCGVVDCPRIVGVERTDRAWLTSSNASDAARIYSEDISMAQEISKMKKGKFVVNKDKENE